jgi:hypothetical protein
MGVITCGGLDCLGAALGLVPFVKVSAPYFLGLVVPQSLLVSR